MRNYLIIISCFIFLLISSTIYFAGGTSSTATLATVSEKTDSVNLPLISEKPEIVNATNTLADPIPVLVYHLVSDNLFTKNSDLFVKPKEFEKQLNWIIKNGYTPIFSDELSLAKDLEKPIIITFDDGYIDNYDVVFKLIKKYNIKITIFVITKMINTDKHLTSDQILEMSASGLVSIQSHTVSHPHMTQLASAELTTELEQSKNELFKLTGRYPTTIAYPYGDMDKKAIELVMKYYSYGYSTSKGNLTNGENKLTISRFGVGRNTTIKDIQIYVDGINPPIKIKYQM